MDTNTDGLALRKLETELAYYKVKLTKADHIHEKQIGYDWGFIK